MSHPTAGNALAPWFEASATARARVRDSARLQNGADLRPAPAPLARNVYYF
jgi:hypothetical protein